MTNWPRRIRDYTETGATMTLTDWLLARIAEDEALARKDDTFDRGPHWGACDLVWVADYLDPECTCDMRSRVLAECEAKRKIVELHAVGDHSCQGPEHSTWAPNCHTLRLLALPYADRPGYDEEWRP